MESLGEGVTQGVSISKISERDTTIESDSVADHADHGLLREIKSDVQCLRESLVLLGDEAEWRHKVATREADTNQLRTDKTFEELLNQIERLGQKTGKNQRTLDAMIKQLWKITQKIDELTSKLRGGFIKFAVVAAAMIMLLCCRAWRLRKQKR